MRCAPFPVGVGLAPISGAPIAAPNRLPPVSTPERTRERGCTRPNPSVRPLVRRVSPRALLCCCPGSLLADRMGSDEFASTIGIAALWAELQVHVDQRWIALLGTASKSINARLAALQKEVQASTSDAGEEDLEDFTYRFCA